MKQFRASTERIALMRELVRDRVIAIDAERALNITESYKRNLMVPPAVKRARATYDVCSRMTCRVEDFELIVGNFGTSFLGCGMWPEEGFEWLFEEFEAGLWERAGDGVYHREDMGTRLSVTEEEKDKLFSIRDFWKDKTVSAHMDAWYPDGFEDWCGLIASSYFPGVPIGDLPSGHLVAGYPKIINTGYAAIRTQAQEWVDAHRGDLMGNDVEKYLFYQSAILVCDAATAMIRGYARTCSEKAAVCADAARKAELEKMGAGLEWIAEKPARTFWEAVQATIMYQLLLYMDCRIPALAFGRFDQYTWPFLEADLAAGRITMDEAREIVEAFLLKANCFYRAAPPFLNEIVGVGNTYQHTTIGGVDPDTGEDAGNPVTYLILESMGNLMLHDSTISLRIHQNPPDKLWDAAIETTKLVGGLPLFQNDEVIVPALVERGFELRDARDYGAVMAGWEGYEPLRQRVMKEIPHYGNDLDYPDELAVWISEVINQKVSSCLGARGNRWSAGLYPVATHVVWGKLTWATPDGRRTGEPLSDGISPVQCMDTSGPAATLKSAARLDHRHSANGTLLNMKFHPRALEGGGKEKLIDLIKTYFDLDGMELQFNITSSDTLREAKKNPDAYRDLVVRIAGFSAYFVELYEGIQDDLIRRTELDLV